MFNKCSFDVLKAMYSDNADAKNSGSRTIPMPHIQHLLAGLQVRWAHNFQISPLENCDFVLFFFLFLINLLFGVRRVLLSSYYIWVLNSLIVFCYLSFDLVDITFIMFYVCMSVLAILSILTFTL